MNQKHYVLCFLALILAHIGVAQQQTLLDRNGERIRGTAIAVGKNYENTSTSFATNPESWELIKSKNLNTVRVVWVDPWFERRGFTHWKVSDSSVVAAYDKAVQNAVDKDMNIVINYHNVGEQERVRKTQNDSTLLEPEDLSRMKAFWEIIAPRYKDIPNVIYEITNEPLFNYRKYVEEGFKTDFLEIYNQVRKDAPDREVIMFSFHGIEINFMEQVLADYNDDIDWSKTSVGYHMYQADNGQLPRRLSKNYRMICTEWDYDDLDIRYVFRVDGYEENSQTMELYGHSWLDWSGWDDNSLNSIDQYLLPDAIAKGYQWWDVPQNPDEKTVTLRAKGNKGGETLEVRIDDEAIGAVTLSTTLDNYQLQTTRVGELKVALVSDAIDSTGIQLDYVAFNDVIKEAEDQTENTAVIQNGSCGGILSDVMNCSGYINFGYFRDDIEIESYDIIAKAKGVNGDEIVQIQVGAVVIDEWTLTTEFVERKVTTDILGTVRFNYINDSGSSDVQLDNMTINGTLYEAEAMPINTGRFDRETKTCGKSFSEQMNCNGYILFPSVEIEPPLPPQTPFGGEARIIPGLIQAEDFDEGGQNVAYFDTSSGNIGGQYRPDSDVDIARSGDVAGGFNIGWFDKDEYLEYTVDVKEGGEYTVEFRVASGISNPGDIGLSINGQNLGISPVEPTGGWQKYTTIVKKGVQLEAGDNQILRITAVNGGGFNLNWIRLSKSNDVTPFIVDGTYYIKSSETEDRIIAPFWARFFTKMSPPSDTADQEWEFVHQGSNVYTIRQKSSGRFLSTTSKRCFVGSFVGTKSGKRRNPPQEWRLIKNGEAFGIVSDACDLALNRIDNLDPYGFVTLQSYSDSTLAQGWMIVPADKDGKKQVDGLSKISVFPNPAREQVTLQFNTTSFENAVAQFYTLRGQMVKHMDLSKDKQQTLDISDLSTGVYLIKVDSEESSQTIKLIVK